MSLQLLLEGEKTKTEFAQIEAIDIVVVDRVGTVIPCVRLELAQLNPVDCFEFCGLLVSPQRGWVHAIVLRVIILFLLFMLIHSFLFEIFLDDFLVDFSNSLERHPLVVAPVERFIMDVVLVRGFIFFAGSIIIYNKNGKRTKRILE